MTNAYLRFGTASASSGRKAFGILDVREGGKGVKIPVCVVHGARPGRQIMIIAISMGRN